MYKGLTFLVFLAVLVADRLVSGKKEGQT